MAQYSSTVVVVEGKVECEQNSTFDIEKTNQQEGGTDGVGVGVGAGGHTDYGGGNYNGGVGAVIFVPVVVIGGGGVGARGTRGRADELKEQFISYKPS